MARPRQIDNDAILEAARALFIEHGPQCSTATIAQAVGVSQAVLFQRFGTKRDLMIAALRPPSAPTFLPLIEAGPDERPIPEQIKEIVAAIFGFFEAVVPGITVLRNSGFDPHSLFASMPEPPPVLAHRALAAWIRRAMKQGRIRKVDAESAAMAWLGALHGRAFYQVIVGAKFNRSNKRYTEELADLLAHALGVEDEL